MSPDCDRMMKETEDDKDEYEETNRREDQQAVSRALYDMLCQLCTGEALGVIKPVSDMEEIRAWQKIYQKYNPKTMAREIRLLCEVTNPPKTKSPKDIDVNVHASEEKMKTLETQLEQKLSNGMKISILIWSRRT